MTDEQGGRTLHHPSTPYVHPDDSVEVSCQCGRNFLADTIEQAADRWYNHLPENKEKEEDEE